MDPRLTRRRFLTLPLLSLALPRRAPADVKGPLDRPCEVDVSVLFNLLTFALKRYTLTRRGTGVSTQTSGMGISRTGASSPRSFRAS